MKVTVDTTKLEDVMKDRLREGEPSDVFLKRLNGPAITRGEALEAIENETDLGQQLVSNLAHSSLRLWAHKALAKE
jgi:N-acyl-D-aspartate/D-glutamate deacylase